jgi:hypothetical protein
MDLNDAQDESADLEKIAEELIGEIRNMVSCETIDDFRANTRNAGILAADLALQLKKLSRVKGAKL